MYVYIEWELHRNEDKARILHAYSYIYLKHGLKKLPQYALKRMNTYIYTHVYVPEAQTQATAPVFPPMHVCIWMHVYVYTHRYVPEA